MPFFENGLSNDVNLKVSYQLLKGKKRETCGTK